MWEPEVSVFLMILEQIAVTHTQAPTITPKGAVVLVAVLPYFTTYLNVLQPPGERQQKW